jgi:hypothetical protein
LLILFIILGVRGVRYRRETLRSDNDHFKPVLGPIQPQFASLRKPGTSIDKKRFTLSGGPRMDDIRTRELYSSSNGDRWHLCKDPSGRVFVVHQANIPSGGRISRIEVGDFLSKGYGPEQQALLHMIGTLLDSDAAGLLTGEADPGLALTGGSGHA